MGARKTVNLKNWLFMVATGAALAAAAAVPKVVFDTDMVEDYDDVGALATLHALADEGRCEILAMASCTRDNQSVAAVEIVNAYYGRPDIPVGCAKNLGVVGVPGGDPTRRWHQKYTRLAREYADWVKHPNSNDAPDANEVYRKALASAPDKSVVFCSVGFLTNIRRLLETPGDQYSPLPGRDLVAKKVKTWHVMAGQEAKGRTYNVLHDAESAKIAFAKWPTYVVVTPCELGNDIYSGRTVAERSYGYRNPVHDIFAWALPRRADVLAGKTEEKEVGGRCSWDEVTVLAAVYGPSRFFESERGAFTLTDDGTTEWVPDPQGRFNLLKAAVTRERHKYPCHTIGAILDELITREPKCRRTDEAISIFRRSQLTRTATGVRMLRDGKTLWNLELDNPEGRPFFHPLALPSGRPLTDLRPKDHVWHLGYWFSWKFINGVNYWEPADEKRTGAEPAGATRLVKKDVRLDGLDCVVQAELEYGPRGEKPVLAESRRITVDPPDPNGGYIITTRHTFTALADVTLDRTPPHGDPKTGKWGGGYAGMTLRLDTTTAKALDVRGFAGGTTPAACTGVETKFLDFTDRECGEGVTFTQLVGPDTGKFYLWPDKRMINPCPVHTAPLTLKKGETLQLAYKLAVHADKRPGGRETADAPCFTNNRALVACVNAQGTQVSWRMLPSDATDLGFTLWRRANGKVEKLNAAPIVQTSDFFLDGYTDLTAEYSLDGAHFTPVRCEVDPAAPFIRLPLADTNETVSAVGVGDLDGDGLYDYVVRTPAGGTDPWDLVWKRATDTYKLTAYDSSGKMLWRKDLGWNIEMGTWYAPYLVADLDGDGKAEVIAKTAPLSPDYRDADGRVNDGPEHLTVFDGLTGRIRAQVPWIPRASPDPVEDYNHYNSRNQLALARRGGQPPCVIMERGTYGKMIVDAYRLVAKDGLPEGQDAALERVWRFNNEFMPQRFKGQGDHACLCEDVDGDGCDEVLIGSLTLDHDGTVLWCNERGHSDAHYYGDIDPERPGMELAFIYETRQRQGGGLLLTDPVTGEDIWQLKEPTHHVHSCGICADIDPRHAGLEIYGQEVDQSGSTKEKTHPQSDNRWFFAANGTLLSSHTNCVYGYGQGVRNAYWDADLQRELFRSGLKDHEGARVTARLPNPMLVADLFGDWREEFIAGGKGEIRIYTTDIPAMDRRLSLMCDSSYRSRITMWTSGYDQQPILTYVPSARDPNVSVRLSENARELVLDVVAPLDRPLRGTLAITQMPPEWSVKLGSVEIDLPPGGLWTKTLKIRRPPNPKGRYDMAAELKREGAAPLIVRQPFVL